MLRSSSKTRFLQWNVFEDGLADTPGLGRPKEPSRLSILTNDADDGAIHNLGWQNLANS